MHPWRAGSSPCVPHLRAMAARYGDPIFRTRTAFAGLWRCPCRCPCPSFEALPRIRPSPPTCRPHHSLRPNPNRTLILLHVRPLQTTAPRLQDSTETGNEQVADLVDFDDAKDRGSVQVEDVPFVPETNGLSGNPASTAPVEAGEQAGKQAGGQARGQHDIHSEPLDRTFVWEQWPKDVAAMSKQAVAKRGSSTGMIEKLVSGRDLEQYMVSATTEDIYEALRRLRVLRKPKYRRITAALVKHLVRIGTAPNTFLYETMLMTHAAPDGSAETVKKLLQEMQELQLPWSSTAYHAALQALAVHPDYLLRNSILKEMKDRWIDITPQGHQDVAIGLLRDEQYELALEKLRDITNSEVQPEPWVYDTFIYVFGKLEFIDDAVRIARHRIDSGQKLPINTWYFLLEACSKSSNIEATTYVWNRTVQQGIVVPSDGVALNVLNMASVHGDTVLCTEVIGFLASRGTRLNRHHYEALIDAYVTQGDVGKALEVYCIMDVAGVKVNHSSTSSLCFALTREPSLISKAIEAMSRLKEGYSIPTTVFNTVLKGIVKEKTENPEDSFAMALDLYRRIRDFIHDGPDIRTFRVLLWRCPKPEVAQFFAGEMVAFGINQDLVVMKHMFRIHVDLNGPIHRAKDYFFKLAPRFNSGYDLEKGSRKAEVMDISLRLVKRLIAERDPAAWRILDVCRSNGLEEEKIDALRMEVETGMIGHDKARPQKANQKPEARWVGDAWQVANNRGSDFGDYVW